jgi:phosphatidylglycerophosphatase C
MTSARKGGTHLTDHPAHGGVVGFDFDGTITVKDSFIAFLIWCAGPGRFLGGLVRLTPALAGYLLRRDRGRLKADFVREYLAGTPRAELERRAQAFADRLAPRMLRPDAVATWNAWRERGATLVIVTASPDVLVAPFARALGADALIGTVLAFDAEGRVAGTFLTANCRGAEKVSRLRAMFGPDLRLAAAYGDTRGDREMLELADERGYRLFKGRP